MTDDDGPACSGCGAEARLPGQRYGRECMNEANRKYRVRLRLIIDAFVSIKKGVNESLK